MGNKPFKLKPAAKDYLWGGSRLNKLYNKNIDMYPLAETWECSTHPDGESVAMYQLEQMSDTSEIGESTESIFLNDQITQDKSLNNQIMQDKSLSDHIRKNNIPAWPSLSEVLKKHPEYLGTHCLELTDGRPELPILIKFIDAEKDLSVQVHPDDEYAFTHENGAHGKTEMWYVLDAQDDSEIIFGFNQDMDEDRVREGIAKGDIGRYLNHIPIHKDDRFIIEPGTVHAIGAGALIAEVQENSNLTYRFYDYDRVDKNGKKRELHIDKAIDVVDFSSAFKPKQPMKVIKYRKGIATELLARCRYFLVERDIISSDEGILFQTESNSFHVLLCIEGEGKISGYETEIEYIKGDCIFVPADSVMLKIFGYAQFLNVSS